MKQNVWLIILVFLLAACSSEKLDGSKMAEDVCNCKTKVPKDDRGIPKDLHDMIECSTIKIKAMEKLKHNETELKKFQDKLGACGDWEFKNK